MAPQVIQAIAGLNLRRPWLPRAGISASALRIVATPDRRKLAVRIASYPEVDISMPFEWNATAAEVVIPRADLVRVAP
jgi:hypothetical protein